MKINQYRVWDSEKSEYIGEFKLFNLAELVNDYAKRGKLEFLHFEQYIGLKDENNRYIYEGDIVRTNLEERISHTEIGYIGFEYGEFVIKDDLDEESCYSYGIESHTWVGDGTGTRRSPTVTIIGNIKEHSDLL